jgi:hypothetical protein
MYKGFIVEINRGTGNAILPEHLRKRWFTFKAGEEKKVLHLVRQCLKDDDMTASDEQYGFKVSSYLTSLLVKKQIKIEASRSCYKNKD